MSAKVLPLIPPPRTLRRRARREVQRMYALTKGGQGPIVCEESREAFERGEIEEVVFLSWGDYCQAVQDRLGRGGE